MRLREDNLKTYQENAKTETLKNLDAALKEMQEKHLKITASSLAEEVGMTRQSMYTPYIKDFLNKHPIYSQRNKIHISDEDAAKEEVEELKAEIERLNSALRACKNKLNKTQAENVVLHNKVFELSDEYSKLLGRYQTDISKKIIKF